MQIHQLLFRSGISTSTSTNYHSCSAKEKEVIENGGSNARNDCHCSHLSTARSFRSWRCGSRSCWSRITTTKDFTQISDITLCFGNGLGNGPITIVVVPL